MLLDWPQIFIKIDSDYAASVAAFGFSKKVLEHKLLQGIYTTHTKPGDEAWFKKVAKSVPYAHDTPRF